MDVKSWLRDGMSVGDFLAPPGYHCVEAYAFERRISPSIQRSLSILS